MIYLIIIKKTKGTVQLLLRKPKNLALSLLHQIKVLEATHQSTLIYIINLQGNIHYIVTAEISAQI